MELSRQVPMETMLSEAQKRLNRGERIAIAVITKKEGSGPREVGSKILVTQDGKVYGTLGGGFFEKHVVQTALKALKEGKPVSQKYSFVGKQVKGAIDTGLICGGILEVFIDVIKPSPRTIVFGVGRIGKPLADLLNFIGVRVVVADLNPELVSEEMFPYAEMRLSGNLNELVEKLASIVKEGDVVFVTHGEPENDYAVVKTMLSKPVRYVGLLGSKRKVMEFIKRLIKDGFKPEDIAKKLRAPVGADIPVETPEEISISIVSEFLAVIKGEQIKSLNNVPAFISMIEKEL
jgi:xanthine dehydrogenase accessory factor